VWRIIVLIASAAINASTIPAVAAERASNKDIDGLRTHWATLRNLPANAADNAQNCRACAASFYEPVTLRQVVEGRVDRQRLYSILRSMLSVGDEVRQLGLTTTGK
jgi:hypothetical protein